MTGGRRVQRQESARPWAGQDTAPLQAPCLPGTSAKALPWNHMQCPSSPAQGADKLFSCRAHGGSRAAQLRVAEHNRTFCLRQCYVTTPHMLASSGRYVENTRNSGSMKGTRVYRQMSSPAFCSKGHATKKN